MPLWASGWIDFVALKIIPAKMQTAIRTKFTIREKYETNLRLIFELRIETGIFYIAFDILIEENLSKTYQLFIVSQRLITSKLSIGLEKVIIFESLGNKSKKLSLKWLSPIK